MIDAGQEDVVLGEGVFAVKGTGQVEMIDAGSYAVAAGLLWGGVTLFGLAGGATREAALHPNLFLNY